MRSDPEGILEAAIQAYAMGDFPAAAAYFAEDVVYAIYIDKDVLPFGGEVTGRAAILAVWQDIRLSFENLKYVPRVISYDDDIVRCQINFAFRHHASGEEIDGVMRVVAQIANGQIVRFREYHDQERLRAFMRLAAGGVASLPDF
jgi:ketosteroid isomerase-like protein